MVRNNPPPHDRESEWDPTSDPTRPHRPVSMVLAFMGSLGFGAAAAPIPSKVLLDVLGQLGVTEGAARRNFSRMVSNDLLVREVAGRHTLFQTSERGTALLGAGRERAGAVAPFSHPDGEWTLLAFSMPESRRDMRHQLRARLSWAGLGPLRDGLWIGPGVVDVSALLSDLPLATADADLRWAFAARPLEPTQLEELIHRVWDVGRIRAQHHRFLERWSAGTTPGELSPMAALTLLISDWLRLLRTDPGLPAAHLGRDWPAERSAKTYQTRIKRLQPQAEAELERALADWNRQAPR